MVSIACGSEVVGAFVWGEAVEQGCDASPEAVAGWGDMDTLLQFYNAQNPNSNPSFKYGLTRVSATQPSWIPSDAGLVDHMFLLFGLVESLEPDYFKNHMFAAIAPGDYNVDGVVDMNDYNLWRSAFGSTTALAADGNRDGVVNAADYAIWRDHYAPAGAAASSAVPEPGSASIAFTTFVTFCIVGLPRRAPRDRIWTHRV